MTRVLYHIVINQLTGGLFYMINNVSRVHLDRPATQAKIFPWLRAKAFLYSNITGPLGTYLPGTGKLLKRQGSLR